MIRFSEYSDKHDCIELLRESHSAANFPFSFCDQSAGVLFEYHHKLSNACIIILDKGGAKGLLMATITPHPFGVGLCASETVWFVSNQARGASGIKMLSAYEEWAKSHGCALISMASLVSNDVSAIYRRRGYDAAETHYVKYLK